MRKARPSIGLRLVRTRPDCKPCAARNLCFSGSGDQTCKEKIVNVMKELGPFSPGEAVFNRGDAFESVYVVQSGVVKTETETLEGRLDVTGFYIAGEMFGLEGIGSHSFPGRALACKKTRICEIAFDDLLQICEDNPALQREFISRLGKRIQADEYEWKLVRKESASYRVRHFLRELYRRQAGSTEDWNPVELPMNKQDIANFLGLSPESFSRALKRLESSGSVKRVTRDCISISREMLNGVI